MLTEAQLEKLEELKKKEGLNKTDIIRRALDEYFKKKK